MRMRRHWVALGRNGAVRTCLFGLGIVLLIAAPIVGVLPGPGGIVLFAAGMALVLKNSPWAKRRYVALKRARPKVGEWADWGMRRRSARRRAAIRAGQTIAGD